MAVRRVRLGAALEPVTRSQAVVPGTIYPMAGVRSFGLDAFKAADLDGADTSYAHLRMIHAGDVVYPKLMAWEGAFAVVDESLDGHFVSPEFCTFRVDLTMADPAFMEQVLKSEQFLTEVRKGAAGTNVRRRMLQPTAFLNIEIPLPEIAEQRRIVERIQAAVIPHTESAAASEILASGLQTFLADSYGELPSVTPLSRVLRQRRDWMPVDSESAYATIGLSKSGRGAFVKAPQQLGATRLMALTRGDFVYSRLFAWQGSMALVPETVGPLYASNEFPAFEIDQELIMPEFLLGWFRRPEVWTEIEKQCTGSTPGSRNRFKESNLLAMLIPVPAIHVQRRIVSGLQAFGQAGILNVRRRELAEALPKSVRNEIFSKLV